MSRYVRVGFTWYKDRRGKEILAKGYDEHEGKVYVPEVSFVYINGNTIKIQKRNVEKAYVETIPGKIIPFSLAKEIRKF